MSGPHNFQLGCGGGDRRNNEAESRYGCPQLLAARVILERKDSVVGKSHSEDPSTAAEPG